MPPLFLVMAGGAIGAGARFLLGRWMIARLGADFPWATLCVNVVGGLLMGALAAALAARRDLEQARLLLGVGLLGGFTTFSAFSLELAGLMRDERLGAAAGYALLSVVGATGALFAGLALGRAVRW